MSEKKDQPPAGNGGGGADPQPAKNAYAGIAFAIEFGSEHNNNTLCPITRRQYRGKWVASNVKGRVPDDWFSRMPDLPGHVIVFDGSKRAVTIIDPLDTPDFKDVLKEAQEVLKGRGMGDEPDETEELTDLTDDDLKNWVYWCRRWVDGMQADAIRGTRVPKMEDVTKLPGRVAYNQFEMHEDRETHPDMKRIPPYRAPVPPKQRQKKRRSRSAT